MDVSVIGTGYLGATHAACLAHLGHTVVGFDVDSDRVQQLSRGESPFSEPDLDTLLAEGISNGRLRFTDSAGELANATVHFLCVGTPQLPDSHGADLSAVWSAVDLLSEAHAGPALLVGKSTVPVGTATAIAKRFASQVGAWDVAWNPEFLREGHAVEDSLHPSRIVIGTDSEAAWRSLCELYRPILDDGVRVIRTDFASAELAKVASNVVLAARLSVVNSLAEVCEASAANVRDLLEVLGSDARIGRDYLTPGVGFGGSCLPKDVRAFAARARELGVDEPMRLFDEVDRVNLRQRSRTVQRALALAEAHSQPPRIAVLGAAFKAGSDDVRDSPALAIAGELHDRGAAVRVYDPLAVPAARRAQPDLTYTEDPAAACEEADLVLVLTEWPQIAALDPGVLAHRVTRPVVLDARLVLDADRWRGAGWEFHSVGAAHA